MLFAFGLLFYSMNLWGQAKPKNIIFFVVDGMGISQLSYAHYLYPKKNLLDRFPVVGFQKTSALDDVTTDSAAAATAMATGKKVPNEFIGVSADSLDLKTIFDYAKELNLATGIVTTSSLTHGTPAPFYAHSSQRTRFFDIAKYLPKSGIDYCVGGGMAYFYNRPDELDLIDTLWEEGYIVDHFINNELFQTRPSSKNKFVYFSANYEPLSRMNDRDYFATACYQAPRFLKKRSDQGFFLLVEAGQVDWACHHKDEKWLKLELDDMFAGLKELLKFIEKNPETLLIFTSDHETGGFAMVKATDSKIKETAFSSNNHTAEMVPVLAIGPYSEIFQGMYENTELFFMMLEAMGISE